MISPHCLESSPVLSFVYRSLQDLISQKDVHVLGGVFCPDGKCVPSYSEPTNIGELTGSFGKKLYALCAELRPRNTTDSSDVPARSR